MDEHVVFRVAVEIAVVITIWVFGASWLLDRAGAPGWLSTVVAIGGAFAAGMLVGWLRLIRNSGRDAPPPLLPQYGIRAKGHMVGACGALLMTILLGVQDGDDAHFWALAFGVLTVVQVVRAVRARD